MQTAPTAPKLSTLRRTATVIATAGAFVLASIAPTIAQDATPAASPESALEIELLNVDSEPVGSAILTESDGGVEITVTVEGLEPGDHGIHIHEMGACDPEGDTPFASAGDHFNPTDAVHGPGPATGATPEADMIEAHAGDLGNITVADDGSGTLTLTTDRVTLAPDAENSLAGANGSALVIHVDPDDLATDPDGASGDRIACGVLFAPVDGGTPTASDESGDSAAEASAPVEALDSLAFSPSEVTVSPGDTIQVINTGALEHDFVVDELDIAIDLPNGEMVEIEIPEDAAPGEYEFYCSIPGHAPAGMVGILIVE
ncbi:hypothetical protein BH20CHL3_BH20CHL3_08990 [soil metagenome]